MYSGVREIFTIPALNQNDILVFQLHDSCSMVVGEQLTTKIKQDMAQLFPGMKCLIIAGTISLSTLKGETVSVSNNTKDSEFEKELESLLNRYSKENGSDTPDFILAEYLIGCLENFNNIVGKRTTWYNPDYRKEI